MQKILQRYDKFTSCFYDLTQKYTKSSFHKHAAYAINISVILAPKLSYYNTYDREYTPGYAKYSAPIVISLILYTFYISHRDVEA